MGAVDQGIDTYCLDSLVTGRLATGVQLVAQRCYRRLKTKPGTLVGGEDEANFGLDLAGYVGSTDADTVDATLPAAVQNELLKDPAVDSVDCTASRVVSAGQVSWTLTIAITSTAGNVELIVSVSSVTVQLLGVT